MTAPTRLSSGLSVAAGAGAAVLSATSVLALLAGGVGVAVLAVGLRRRVRVVVTLGAATVFLGVVLAGVTGAPAVLLLPATLGCLLAYDLGENAVTLGEQVGRDAPTARVELVHAAASLAVGAAGGGGAYLAYRSAGGGAPALAVVALLTGAVALALALTLGDGRG